MQTLHRQKFMRVVLSVVTLTALAFSAMPLLSASAAEDNAEGAISLQVINPSADTPWVGVQFQDPAGGWHNVDAWVGPFDQSQWGFVINWVDPKDFGTGPFRWILWDKQGGSVVATSASFYFPTYATTIGSTIDLSVPAAPAQ